MWTYSRLIEEIRDIEMEDSKTNSRRVHMTKAKDRTRKRQAIKDVPHCEARSHPEILEKCLVHSDNHGISVSHLRIHGGPMVIVGQDMKGVGVISLH
jgi:hypothetical protein